MQRWRRLTLKSLKILDMREITGILTIASRDLIKFLRDKPRFFGTFMFPVIFIGVLGGSLQASIGEKLGFNYLTFVFIGVIAQTLFQSTASGVIFLIQDRETDFSQEIFVSPISRYSIILGKILGESLVSMAQVVGILLFGLIARVPFSFAGLAKTVPLFFVASFLGGAFGILVLSHLNNQRAAQQVFPFIIFPQFFLAGVFNPLHNLPFHLFVLSRIAPMTYAIDFIRGIYYWGTPEYSKVVLNNPLTDLLIIAVFFIVFLLVGTYFFVRKERDR